MGRTTRNPIQFPIKFTIIPKVGATSQALLSIARENFRKIQTVATTEADKRRLFDTNKSLFSQIAQLRHDNQELMEEVERLTTGRYKIGFTTLEPMQLPKFKDPFRKVSLWDRVKRFSNWWR